MPLLPLLRLYELQHAIDYPSLHCYRTKKKKKKFVIKIDVPSITRLPCLMKMNRQITFLLLAYIRIHVSIDLLLDE